MKVVEEVVVVAGGWGGRLVAGLEAVETIVVAVGAIGLGGCVWRRVKRRLEVILVEMTWMIAFDTWLVFNIKIAFY